MVGTWASMDTPYAGEISPSPDKKELICIFPMAPFILSLAYNGVFLLLCVFFAFKTRKLPDNYNESKFISFCVYCTIVIWLAFIPAYFAVSDNSLQVMLISFSILITSSVILLCIFIPKVYALYFVDKGDLHVTRWKFKSQNGTRRLVMDNNSCEMSTQESSPDTKRNRTNSGGNDKEKKDSLEFCGIVQLQVSPAPLSQSIDGSEGWL